MQSVVACFACGAAMAGVMWGSVEGRPCTGKDHTLQAEPEVKGNDMALPLRQTQTIALFIKALSSTQFSAWI